MLKKSNFDLKKDNLSLKEKIEKSTIELSESIYTSYVTSLNY